MDVAAADASLPARALSGWGRAHQSWSALLPAPPGELLQQAVESLADVPLIARGCGSSYGDAATRDGGRVVDMGSRSALLHFDPVAGIAVAEAGLTLGALLAHTAVHGWRPPVLPGTPHVTLGGAVAADIHGKNHPRAGSIGAHVEWLVLIGGDLQPRFLTPDSRPDQFWATVGGLGLTGVIVEVALRLTALGPGPAVTTRQRATSLTEVKDLLAQAHRPGEGTDSHAVAWLDPCHRSGRGLVDTTVLSEAVDRLNRHAAELRDHSAMGTIDRFGPRSRNAKQLPGRGLVGRGSIRAASTARWLAPTPRRRSHDVAGALMPMSHAEAWPRAFGRAGLIQYQFVVPYTAGDAVADILQLLRRRRVTPALAVFKRLGPGDPAPLGFALDGWTLALDFPARWPQLRPALLAVDRQVIDAGGRVYLAKDLRLEPDALAAMYPHLSSWRRTRDAMDPDKRFASDLSRRLHLTA